MYADNEILFPHHAIITLKHVRGPEWQALVERIVELPEAHEETIAFMLMMIRLNGCLSCETDSYRAMRGCSSCAQQTLRRHKASDAELIALFQQTLEEVRTSAERQPALSIIRPKMR